MGIILKILMIIGILLLVILGLVLLVLAVVLLSPVRYKAEACADGNAVKVNAAVRWMLFVKVLFSFENKEIKYSVRLFGRQFFPKPPKPPEERKPEEAVKQSEIRKPEEAVKQSEIPKPAEALKLSETPQQPSGSPELSGVREREEESEAAEARKSSETAEKAEHNESQTENASSETPKKSFAEKLEKLLAKLHSVLEICESEKNEVERFLKRKSTKYTLNILKRDLLRLLGHIRPRRLEGNVEFGFDDPAYTGYTLAALSMFYGIYCENLEVTPDFTEKVLKGRLSCSGRIVLGYVGYIGLDIYLRKQVRLFVKNVIGLKDTTLDNMEEIKNRFTADNVTEG